jgi:prolipoprotein diacylglyceryltransferase
MKYAVIRMWQLGLFVIAIYALGMICGAALFWLYVNSQLDTWERSNRSRVEGYNMKEKLYHARNR